MFGTEKPQGNWKDQIKPPSKRNEATQTFLLEE